MIANPVWGISRSNTSHVTPSWICCVFCDFYVFFSEMTSNNFRILLFLYCWFQIYVVHHCIWCWVFPRVLAWDPMGVITILPKPSRESICWSIQVRPWMFFWGGRQPKVMEDGFQYLFSLFFTPIPGEMLQFDLRIFFQMGWFNHQLAKIGGGWFRWGYQLFPSAMAVQS